MKILVVLPDLGAGGAERVSINLGKFFKNKDFQVIFLVMVEGGDLLGEAKSQFEVHSLNCTRLRNGIQPIAHMIDRLCPDIILVHMWPLTVVTLLAQFFARHKAHIYCIEHIPLLTHEGKRSFIKRVIVRLSIILTYRFAARVIGVSDGVASNVRDLARPSKLNVATLYNPVVVTYNNCLEPMSFRASDTDGSRPFLLTVGSLKRQKNHELLIKAFFHGRFFENFDLVIIGEGPERSNLEVMISSLGMSRYISLIGYESDVFSWYRRAELFVLSSDYEGLPTVLIEALSVGLTVVSTDCCYGPAEILDGGKFGYLVAPRDLNALIEGIRLAASKKIDKNISQCAASRFTIDKAGEKYLDLFSSTGAF